MTTRRCSSGEQTTPWQCSSILPLRVASNGCLRGRDKKAYNEQVWNNLPIRQVVPLSPVRQRLVYAQQLVGLNSIFQKIILSNVTLGVLMIHINLSRSFESRLALSVNDILWQWVPQGNDVLCGFLKASPSICFEMVVIQFHRLTLCSCIMRKETQVPDLPSLYCSLFCMYHAPFIIPFFP